MVRHLIPDFTGVDIGTGESTRTRLDAAIRPGEPCHIATDGWTRCDLAGLAILVAAARTAAGRGAMLGVGLPQDGLVLSQMRACGLDPDALSYPIGDAPAADAPEQM